MAVKKELMEILACPKCKGNVEQKKMFILCRNCNLAFPILDGDTPDMILEDAWDIKKAEKADFIHKLKL